MAVTDVWTDWSTSAASNSPLASAVPEIDSELRNVKAQVKANVMDLVTVQACTAAKTFANCTVGTALSVNTANCTALSAATASCTALSASGVVTFSALSTAGYLKNSTAGVVSGGNSIVAGDLPAASTSAAGAIEIATDAEALARTDTTRAITASQLKYGYQKYAILEHQQANNTAGGTATSGSWLQYPLNTEVIDADSIVSILTDADANRFQLGAGTYRIRARAVFGQTGTSRIRLYDYTNTTALKSSLNQVTGTAGLYTLSTVELAYEFTITGTTKLEIQYQVGTTDADNGLGSPTNFTEVEVYGQVEIWMLK